MTDYETEWERQRARNDIPAGYLPVHRWYLRLPDPSTVEVGHPPSDDLMVMRACNPSRNFYRFLYHTAGEEFLWGDRRRMGDEELMSNISRDDVHLMVLYRSGTPAGFFEIQFAHQDYNEIKYFALLPGNLGKGLGSYLLRWAIDYGGKEGKPIHLDTCTLDHSSALENYKNRGFVVYREADEKYPDPRLDGTIRKDAGKHVPLAQ